MDRQAQPRRYPVVRCRQPVLPAEPVESLRQCQLDLPRHHLVPQQQALGGRGGRGGGFSQPDPLDFNDHEGWTQIFDGQSLANWDCDDEFWSIVDGAITARSTAEKPAGTVYCIYSGSEPADFELKLKMKLTGNPNSGIQYRSARNAARGGGRTGGPGREVVGSPQAPALRTQIAAAHRLSSREFQ